MALPCAGNGRSNGWIFEGFVWIEIHYMGRELGGVIWSHLARSRSKAIAWLFFALFISVVAIEAPLFQGPGFRGAATGSSECI
jgi:hypothetical protein